MNWKLAALHLLGLALGLFLLWLAGWTWLGSARELGPVPKLGSLALLIVFLAQWHRAWSRS